MQVFNSNHFLRHISLPTLRQFTEQHVIAPRLAIDWSRPETDLHRDICAGIDAIAEAIQSGTMSAEDQSSAEADLMLWQDDLRRAHAMANPLAIQEFRASCEHDDKAISEFAERDDREIALWMLTHRETLFRNAELHLAFQSKTNGKYWKKHRIQPGLTLRRDRESLEAFCREVAALYKKAGAGKAVHIELSERPAEHSVQLTIYVEGPVTTMAHFTQNQFTRVKARIALESALLYNAATGSIETIVKGGVKNHEAVLTLFGKHVVGQTIDPKAIEKRRYNLNVLRDGIVEPFEDWSTHGVAAVRLRRAFFRPVARAHEHIRIEASPQPSQDDAITIARRTLSVERTFETEYNIDGASVIVYKCAEPGNKPSHFSFDIFSAGSSTIRNLSAPNQPLAEAVLSALNVIEPEAA